MRTLVVHNRYSSLIPSGENVSVSQEVAWLREAGVEVVTHEVTNDEVLGAGLGARLRVASETVWSPRAGVRFGEVLDEVRPDLVHVHNLFPLFTASVPWRAVRRRVPVVWTARNLRVVCVEGTHYRDGGDCADCRPGWRVPGIRHGCYRGSVAASALVTGSTAIFRRLARSRLTVVATSERLRTWLIDEAGFAPEQVRLKYNGAPEQSPAQPVASPARSSTFLFIGKFASYKGIDLLLDAWGRVTSPTARLCFVGDGPDAARVAAAVAADPGMTWTGRLPVAGVTERIASARAVIVPSVWDEPFGRVAVEAFALGRPVITTGRGGLAEVVGGDAGWVTGTDPAALARAIDEAAAADDEVAARGAAGRDRHARLFSPKATTAALLDIYQATVDAHRERPGRSPH